MSNSELKAKAKESMKGKWGKILPVIILYSLITGAISGVVTVKYGNNPSTQISASTSLITSIITAFFVLGYNSFFLKLARNKDVEVNELWSKTGQFIRAFVATFLISLAIGVGIVLLIVPAIIFALMFSMTMFIMVDDENISAIDAMKKSAEMMKGHKGDLFGLILSFIGWMLLGLLTFGILYLWLMPYMNTAMCNFYDSIKG